jgi:hypothetical protein
MIRLLSSIGNRSNLYPCDRPCAYSSVSITYLGISLFPFPSCFFLRCPVRTTFVLPLALDQSKVWSTSRGGQVFWQSRQHSRSEDGLVRSHSISGANHGYFQGGGRQDVRSKIVQHSFKHIHDFTPAHPDAGFCRHEGSHSGHRSTSLEQVQRKRRNRARASNPGGIQSKCDRVTALGS